MKFTALASLMTSKIKYLMDVGGELLHVGDLPSIGRHAPTLSPSPEASASDARRSSNAPADEETPTWVKIHTIIMFINEHVFFNFVQKIRKTSSVMALNLLFSTK